MSAERLYTSEVARTLLEHATQRREPATAKPSFRVSQVKGVGGTTVIEWDVQVPVCDEYPNAEAAYLAAIDYAADLAAKFAPADTLRADLEASVKR